MTSVCYLIVCVNLLYCFDQIESKLPYTQNVIQKEDHRNLQEIINDGNLAKKLTPYCNLTYDEQLEKKQKRATEIIDSIVKRSGNLTSLMKYTLFQIVPTSATKAYRNKDYFYIKQGFDRNPKTVGCVLEDKLAVHPTKIVTIKESHKRVAQVYENFIRSSSVRPFNFPKVGGHWSTLIVRSNSLDCVLASVTVSPRGYTFPIVERQKQLLRDFFVIHLPNISLFHQVCHKENCTHLEAPFTLLYGKPFLLEYLNGYMFRIKPDTFFPCNKFSFESMYDTVMRTANLNDKTTILDINSVGVSSTILSKFVREVFVFESHWRAFTEAHNVVCNNKIPNAKIMFDKVNVNLNSVLAKLDASSDVVALVGSRPEEELELAVIETLRTSIKISRLVYISKEPNNGTSIKLYKELCSNDGLTVPPFRLTKVIPIDLLPQTASIEFILIFEREPVGNISNTVLM